MWQWKYTQSNQVWRPVKIAQLTGAWKATNLFLSPLPTWPEPVSGSLPSSACCVSGTNSHTQHSLWKLITFSHKILHRFFFGSQNHSRCAVQWFSCSEYFLERRHYGLLSQQPFTCGCYLCSFPHSSQTRGGYRHLGRGCRELLNHFLISH